MALAVSLRETIASGPRAFFEAALMLTFFLLVGRYLAHRTRAGARSAAAEIAALEVRTAERIAPDGSRATVPLDARARRRHPRRRPRRAHPGRRHRDRRAAPRSTPRS